LVILVDLNITVPGCWKVFSPARKKTSSQACQGRARFQQHRDASRHQGSFSLQGKAPQEINTILREILACFLPGRAKDLSAHLLYRQRRAHMNLNTIIQNWLYIK